MCTIGNVFTSPNKGIISFKQCDLKSATNFLVPKAAKPNSKGISYYPFMREGGKGPWAGINNFGVSFVAADSYLAFDAQQKSVSTDVSQDIFEAYTKILSEYKTAYSAKEYMVDFYKKFQGTDILLITDAYSAWFIEADNGEIACIDRTDQFFASTNHMRMLYEGTPYNQNHSSYLRLDRAQNCLQSNPNATGVLNVLKDQYFGKSVFSVCRSNSVQPSQEEPYYTQATAIMYTDGKIMNAIYQLNGNPRENPYVLVSDIFGKQEVTYNLSEAELAKRLTTTPTKLESFYRKRTAAFKFSGRIHSDDKFHQLREHATEDHVIPPNYVYVPGIGSIPQYAHTVQGVSIEYDPAGNCDGYFMSAKFQPNNNCYAYGTNICSNSFPQPGRKNGYLLPDGFDGEDVVNGAQLDGLIKVGTTIEDLSKHATSVNGIGHYVALMISAPAEYGWTGDYHWARCDVNTFDSWSQKDGSDQVTNFDFAGNLITDPSQANWTVNQGPIGSDNPNDLIANYEFYCYMWVPPTGVDII